MTRRRALTNEPAPRSGPAWRRSVCWLLTGFAALFGSQCLDAVGTEVWQRTLLLDAAVAGNAIVAVGERGTILRSDNNGHSWTVISSHATATLTGISFANAQAGWAVGHDALILTTTDGGLSWTKQWQGDLNDSFLDVLAVDAKHVFAVGAYGLYVTTVDGGKTWSRQKIQSEDYHLNRITHGADDELYVAGEHGTLLRSRNLGKSWVPLSTSYDGSFYGVLPLGNAALVCYGLRGRVFRSENDGNDWIAMPTDQPGLIATGARLSDGTLVLAGQLRAVLVSHAARSELQRRDVGVTTGIAELIPMPNGNLLAVGEAGASVVPRADLASASSPQAP